MATDGEGGNPGGRGLFAGAMNALRGASQKASSSAWNSGKFEFDTSGVRQFKTEIDAAEKSVAKFVGHFDRLSKILSGLDQKKLDALGKIGGAATGSRNGGDTAFSGGAGAVVHGQDAPTTSGDKVRAADAPRGGGGEGHNTNRFGGMDGGGGLAGTYFATELIQMAGSRFAASKQATRSDMAGYDYATTVGMMRGGGSYNSVGANANWRTYGAESREDAVAAQTRVNMHWGAGGMGQRNRFLQSAGSLNALTGGALGGQSGAIQSWEQAFFSPAAQHALIQQGIRPAIENGRPRDEAGLYGDIILKAAGLSSFDQMSRSKAEALFGYGGVGRQNLGVIAPGMSPEMIDAMGLLASQASGGRGVRKALESNAVKDSIIGEQFKVAGRDVEAGAEQTRRGKETQKAVIRAEGELADAANRVKSEFATLTPIVQALGDKITGFLGAGTIARGLFGNNAGEGGGGLGGVVSTATDIAILRKLGQVGGSTASKGLLGRAGGFLAKKAPWIAGGLAAGTVAHNTATGSGPFDLGQFFDSDKSVMDRVRTADDMARSAMDWIGLGDAEADPRYSAIQTSAGRVSWEHDTHFGDGPLRGPGRTAGLKPDFLAKLKAMFEANPRLSLTSGFRTKQEQTNLWNNRHNNPLPVARPGTSAHESGYAADIGPRDQYGWLKANAPKFGLQVPLANDPPHVTPLGGAPLAPSQQPQGDEEQVSGGAPASGGGFAARHKFAEGFATSTSALVGATSKAPRFKHSFGGGGGLGAGVDAVVGGGGGAAAGNNGAGKPEILAALRAAGFSGESLRMAYAIGMAESSGNTSAVGDVALQNSKWGPSVGFFQVRSLNAEKGKGTTRDADRLMDINFAARSAWEISGGGKNWKPWTMYTNGGYKSYYDAGIGDAEAAMGGPHGAGRASGGGQGGGAVVTSLGGVSLSVNVLQATEAEATRLAKMVISKIEQEAKMKALGAV
jgi:hypothetical protein